MGYNIDVRLKAARKFLNDGDKVKIIVNLKGRENEFRNNAIKLIRRFQNDVGEASNRRVERLDAGMSNNAACLEVADAPSSSEMHESYSSEMHESDSSAAATGLLLLPPLWLMLAGLLLLLQCCCEAAATRCWSAG